RAVHRCQHCPARSKLFFQRPACRHLLQAFRQTLAQAPSRPAPHRCEPRFSAVCFPSELHLRGMLNFSSRLHVLDKGEVCDASTRTYPANLARSPNSLDRPGRPFLVRHLAPRIRSLAHSSYLLASDPNLHWLGQNVGHHPPAPKPGWFSTDFLGG